MWFEVFCSITYNMVAGQKTWFKGSFGFVGILFMLSFIFCIQNTSRQVHGAGSGERLRYFSKIKNQPTNRPTDQKACSEATWLQEFPGPGPHHEPL